MKRVQLSIRSMLMLLAAVALGLAVYKYLTPSPRYEVATFDVDYYPLESNVFGKRFFVVVTNSEIRDAPTWDRRTPFPPLSPTAAIALADQRRAALIKNKTLPSHDSEYWVLDSLQLIPFDSDEGQWFWVAHFFVDIDQSGSLNEINLPVLMDGTVLELQAVKNNAFEEVGAFIKAQEANEE